MGPHLRYSWEKARADGKNSKLVGPFFTESEGKAPAMVDEWSLTLYTDVKKLHYDMPLLCTRPKKHNPAKEIFFW